MLTIKQIKETIIREEHALVFPLKYDCGYIWDSAGHMVLQMRGWGYIQYLDQGEKSEELQDSIVDWVVRTLNKAEEDTK